MLNSKEVQEMIVCQCRGITDRKIKRLVRKGATTTREIAQATGAGTCCGGCRTEVRQVLNQAVALECERRESGGGFLEMILPMDRKANADR